MSIVSVPASNTPGVSTSDAGNIRILHLNAGNLYGGVETVLTTLARLRHLCPSMEPQFAMCYEGRSSRELTAAGVPVHILGRVRISRPWTVWRARRRLRELLGREHFDAVVCHMTWPLVVFGNAARASGKKIVFWAHGVPTSGNWLERLARRTVPDLAIFNSRYTAISLAKLFPGVPARVVYNPVALEDAPEASRWRSAIRQKQAVTDETAVIVQVSRLQAWKGHLLLLEALAELKGFDPWVCWIVGGAQKPEEEEYLRELQQTASRYGIAEQVRFLGQRADVPELLAAADIFCQPNREPEPFGISFIEALWAGRPVVTTAMGGALEILDESCGLLVEPGDARALAASLARLIQSPDLRARLGGSGAARARQLSDPTRQMKALHDFVSRRRPENG